MNTEDYKMEFTQDDAVGWQYIDKKLKKVYNEKEPRHYPPLCGVHYIVGGIDTLDGLSNFNSNFNYCHLWSYNLFAFFGKCLDGCYVTHNLS